MKILIDKFAHGALMNDARGLDLEPPSGEVACDPVT